MNRDSQEALVSTHFSKVSETAAQQQWKGGSAEVLACGDFVRSRCAESF